MHIGNAKMQRDKRRKPAYKTDSGNSADHLGSGNVSNSDTAPQPQRANRRQGNESTVNNSVAEAPNKGVTQEVKEKTVIDHSNLKRETEEIAKLTKKFSKREITSNWHRYSAAQIDPRANQVEEEVPADFSDLLQVPVSRGGHLQFKEEQEWSSAAPGSQWALDLRQLSLSLACIPTHERLRLPQDKLSEEEIQRFVFLAEEAKKHYNPNEGADLKDDVAYREKPFSILDVERSTNALLNMHSELEVSSDSISNNDIILGKTDSKLSNEIKLNLKEEVQVEKNIKPQKINDFFTSKELDSNYEKHSSDEVVKGTNTHNNSKLEAALQENKLKDKSPVIKTQPLEENHVIQSLSNNKPSIFESSPEVTIAVKSTVFDSTVECNTNQTNNYEVKEKRPKRTSRKSPMKEEVVNKTVDNVNEIKLEDDDDLDFLLSLKKPVPSQKETDSTVGTLKDSSFLPGGPVASSTTQGQHSELDDWLDSVLQD